MHAHEGVEDGPAPVKPDWKAEREEERSSAFPKPTEEVLAEQVTPHDPVTGEVLEGPPPRKHYVAPNGVVIEDLDLGEAA